MDEEKEAQEEVQRLDSGAFVGRFPILSAAQMMLHLAYNNVCLPATTLHRHDTVPVQTVCETIGNTSTGGVKPALILLLFAGAATGLLLSTFALVFAAEWGDKSFLATIALSAASSPVGVVAGAVSGHGVATLIAVLGGSVLGQYLNEKVVQYVGGSMFLVFAGITAFDVYKTITTG